MNELIAVVGLVLIFALSMWRKINMGAVALVIAFLAGVFVFGQTGQEIAAGFPGGLLVTLLGVTFLFGTARANGTVDQIVGSAVGAVRGRVALVPWVFFLLAAIITGSGALSAATNAILIPIGLAFAQRYRISPLLIGLSIINGTNAGGFSPIAVYFTIVDGALSQIGITVDPVGLFVWTFIASFILNVAAFLILGGPSLLRRGRESDEAVGVHAGDGDRPGIVTTTLATLKASRWTLQKVITVALMLTVLVGALVFKLDVGFLALGAAVILCAVFPGHTKAAMDQIGWSVILLIGGIITYIAVLERAGVIEGLANSVAGVGVPLVAALLLLLVAGVVSAFASTNAMFVVLVPLAAPLLTTGSVGVMGFVIALCISASVVDSSPFSTGGALVVANTEEAKRERTFRGMMTWGLSMIVVAPVLSWLAFVVV